MTKFNCCPKCGAQIDEKGPHVVCGRCLLQLALDLHPQAVRSEEPRPHNDSAQTPPPTGDPNPLANETHNALLESIGDFIGPYRLLERIGEGGFGDVWMAEQLEPMRRKVALKVIKLGMDTRQVVARFEAERQALAIMDHPGIARVFDGGVTRSGRPYFVMELVRGLRITDYCDANKLTIAERLTLFVQSCEAVEHAHQKGIIHRDLKPSNILVTEQDGKPVPKVIDFGIAKATQQPLTQRTLLTGLNEVIGTPAYMSPEQTGLGALDIDTRSDVYSLGVLLYELLTGDTPFPREQLRRLGVEGICSVIREQDPPKPSTRLSSTTPQTLSSVATSRSTEPAKLNRSMRGELDWVSMKALEKNRNLRYESANGLAADIRRYLQNEPVAAGPPSQLYRLRKTFKRNRIAFLAAGAVGISLLGGLGISTWSYFRERTALQNAKREASRSNQVAKFLKEMLRSVGPSVALGRDTQMLREILDKMAGKVGSDLGEYPQVEAEMRHTVMGVYYDLGEFEKAEQMCREVIRIMRQLHGDDHIGVLTSRANLATMLQEQAKRPETLWKLAEAEAVHREVLAARKRVLPPEHPDVLLSMNNLANLLADKGDLSEAENLHRKLLAIARRQHGDDHIEVAGSLNNLGVVLKRQRRFSEAEICFRGGLELRRKLFGNDHPQVSMSLVNVGDVLADQWRFADAEAWCQEAQQIQRKILSRSHPLALESSLVLANVLYREAKHPESIAVFREMLSDYAKSQPARDDRVLRIKTGLARSLSTWASSKTKDSQKGPSSNSESYPIAAEAERLLRDCLVQRESDTNTPPWRVAETRSILAESLVALAESDTNREPASSMARLREAEELLIGAHTLIQESKELNDVNKHDSFLRILRLFRAQNTLAPDTVGALRINEWNEKRIQFAKSLGISPGAASLHAEDSAIPQTNPPATQR